MSKVRFQQTISLDGYSAGPNQSEEEPLGEGGEAAARVDCSRRAAWREAHGGSGGEENASTLVAEELGSGYGAVIMGRKMFGPIGGGDWGDGSWKGWWGDNPPYHSPVSSSPTTSASRSRWRAAPPSTSSPTASSPRWSKRARRPATRTS